MISLKIIMILFSYFFLKMDERKQLKEQNSLTFMVIPSTISSNMGLLYVLYQSAIFFVL